MRIQSLLIVTATLAITPVVARAQAGSAAAAERECEKAARTVDHGHPAKKLDPALLTLHGCPKQLAELYVSMLGELRSSRDTAELALWSWRSADLRDGTIFSAARDVARSPSASAEARTFALITLQLLVNPRGFTPYSTIAKATAAGITNQCSWRSLGHNEPMIGTTPMPIDAASQFSATLTALMADPLTPPLLRIGAVCM